MRGVVSARTIGVVAGLVGVGGLAVSALALDPTVRSMGLGLGLIFQAIAFVAFRRLRSLPAHERADQPTFRRQTWGLLGVLGILLAMIAYVAVFR